MHLHKKLQLNELTTNKKQYSDLQFHHLGSRISSIFVFFTIPSNELNRVVKNDKKLSNDDKIIRRKKWGLVGEGRREPCASCI